MADNIVGVRVHGYEVIAAAARYKIYITLRDTNGDTREVPGAQQRWSKITAFDSQMKKKHKTSSPPTLQKPRRNMLKSKFDVMHLEARVKSFDAYLKALLEVVDIRDSEEYLEFLTVDVADSTSSKDKSGNGNGNGNGDGDGVSTFSNNDAARAVLADQPFVDLKVPANQTKDVSIPVSSSAESVVYEFTTLVKDIGLTVTFRPDAGNASTKEMVPFTRYDSHLSAIVQIFKCPTPGTLVLVFDNTYSRMRSKKLKYRYTLTSTEALDWLLNENGGAPATNESKQPGRGSEGSSRSSDASSNTSTSATTPIATNNKHHTAPVTTGNPFSSSVSPNLPARRKSLKQGSRNGRDSRAQSRSLSPVGRLTLGKHTSTGRPSPFGQGTANDRLMKASVALKELELIKIELQSTTVQFKDLQRQFQNSEAALSDERMKSTSQKEEINALTTQVKEFKKQMNDTVKEQSQQSQRRVLLEKDKVVLENKHKALDDKYTAMELEYIKTTDSLKKKQILFDVLEQEKETLETALATTVKPLEQQRNEAVQMQQQAEAELHTAKQMMLKYQKETQTMKPFVEKLQSKVDKYKMEKKVLVKA